MKNLFTIIIATMMMFSLNAIAAEDKEIPKFKKADTNSDKFVDADEFGKVKADAGVEKKFSELDEDKDGKLNKEEYSALLEEDCE